MKADELLILAKELPWRNPIFACRSLAFIGTKDSVKLNKCIALFSSVETSWIQ
jgi:hypothetical protein